MPSISRHPAPSTGEVVTLKMNNISFAKFLENSPCILGEGAVIERLRRNGDLELDPFLVNSAFIYEDAKRAALETICRQYLDIGREFDLPLLMSTPTWRASRERIDAAGYAGVDVNGDNVRFLDALRKSYGAYAEKVVICGLMSCRGDAYSPADALAVDEAQAFHAWQAGKLADAGVRFPSRRHASGPERGNRPCVGSCRHRQAVRHQFRCPPRRDAAGRYAAERCHRCNRCRRDAATFGLSDQLHPCLLCQGSADA